MTLTHKMRSTLFRLDEKGWRGSITNTTMNALEKRGLVEYHTVNQRSFSGDWKLTEAGWKLKEEYGHGARK